MLHRSAEIVQGVYFYLWVGRGINSNSIVLANALGGAQPHILVDPGMTDGAMGEKPLDSLAEAMASDGLKLEDVGLVFGTHSHPDHFEAVDEVVRRTGARVAMSALEYDFMRGVGGALYGAFGTQVPASKPSLLLRDGRLELEGEGWQADVLVTPGHSPGCACIYIPQFKVLVSGDVVFPGSIGRMDMAGGSALQMKESIERLSTLDIDFILPGHSSMSGPLVSGRDNVLRNFQMVRMFF